MDQRLRELDFGRWEGQPWQEIERHEIDLWAEDLAHSAPHGGETLAEMLDRVSSALCEARQLAEPHSSRQPITEVTGPADPGQQPTAADVVWISHAGVARCVQWLMKEGGQDGRLPSALEWPREAPAPGAWALYPLGSPDESLS